MKRIDPDIKAIAACIRALDGSSSRDMLAANMEFLYDRYIRHPSRSLPVHLHPIWPKPAPEPTQESRG
jgi:hypothetical protein